LWSRNTETHQSNIKLMSKIVLSRMERILSRHFFIKRKTINSQKKFQDLGLNSMEVNEVLFYMEHEFHISLDDQVANHICTVGDALVAVEHQLKNLLHGREIARA